MANVTSNSFSLLSMDDDAPTSSDRTAKKKNNKSRSKTAAAAQSSAPSATAGKGFGEVPEKATAPAKQVGADKKKPVAKEQPAKAAAAAEAKAAVSVTEGASVGEATGSAGWSEVNNRKAETSSEKPDLPLGSKPLVWIDCEMTGLDLTKDRIMEIACIVTDGSLQRSQEGPSLVIHTSEEALAGMNEWCIDHHGASGLTERCRSSSISMKDAEEQVLAFIQQYTEEGQAVMAGNSVYADMNFIRKDMPRLANHFTYRIVDVSTLKALADRWYPSEWQKCPRKKNEHRALADIQESINELKYYRRSIFKPESKK